MLHPKQMLPGQGQVQMQSRMSSVTGRVQKWPAMWLSQLIDGTVEQTLMQTFNDWLRSWWHSGGTLMGGSGTLDFVPC